MMMMMMMVMMMRRRRKKKKKEEEEEEEGGGGGGEKEQEQKQQQEQQQQQENDDDDDDVGDETRHCDIQSKSSKNLHARSHRPRSLFSRVSFHSAGFWHNKWPCMNKYGERGKLKI